MSLIDHTPLTDRPAAPSAGNGPAELSRHTTAEGTTVWLRCSCGRLRMVFTPESPLGTPLFAGGRTAGCPDCG
ncbi:hypothetical protein [Streptomyces avicenniae]|uniref:hypothetical protein n=1 Tax=Streptomyces avicenniae TaxID=500153 RepID=UPI00069B7BE0|nr:hypothetical protein [Streptomyces avicenniae]